MATKLRLRTEQDNKPPEIADAKTKQQCFDRHRARCFFKEGDCIFFKKPKRNRVYGKVVLIVEDINLMYWSKAENPQPMYIKIEVDEGDQGKHYVWVTESKIAFSFGRAK